MQTLWYTRCPVPTASGVALDYGWLREEFATDGIDVRSVRAAADIAVRSSHFTHSMKGMFREGGNIPPIWARSKGRDTVVVALTWVPETQRLLVRPDAPIHSAKDLAGKRIGLPAYAGDNVDFIRATTLHGVVAALSLAGLSLADVSLIDIHNTAIDLQESAAVGHPSRIEVDALLEGRIDVVYLKGTEAVNYQQQHGLRCVVDLGAQEDRNLQINNGSPRVVTVDRDLAETRPDLVARYLSVLIRTGEWARQHPHEVATVVAKETASTPEVVRDAHGEYLHQNLALSIDSALIDALEKQKTFLFEHGFLAGDFDVQKWVNRSIFPVALSLAAHRPVV